MSCNCACGAHVLLRQCTAPDCCKAAQPSVNDWAEQAGSRDCCKDAVLRGNAGAQTYNSSKRCSSEECTMDWHHTFVQLFKVASLPL